jgi:signal transduction histidine kinase
VSGSGLGSRDQGAAVLPGVSRVAAGAVALVAVLVLVGWVLGIEVLVSPRAGASTKFNTALCLLLLALAVLLRRRGWVVLAVSVTTVLAGLTLTEYVTGLDFAIDELVVSDPSPTGGNQPGRMAPATAVSLLGVAGALAALERGRRALADALLVLPLVLGALALVGYGYQVRGLYSVGGPASMSVPTAVVVMLLAVSVALVVPRGTLPWALTDRGPGAALVRRVAPFALVFLPLLGWVRLQFGDTLDERAGVGFSIIVAALALLGVTILTARRLDLAHRRQLAAQEELEALNARLVEGRDAEWRRAEELRRSLADERARFDQAIGRVDDLVWTVEIHEDGAVEMLYSSPNAAGLFGGPLPEGRGAARTVGAMVHPDDVATNAAFMARVSAEQPAEAEVRLVGLDGATRWVWTRATPRREGSRLFYDGISTNVTERRQLADRLLTLERERGDRLRETQRLRDEFVALAGHEMRTPLAAIRGYVELLLDSGELTAEQRSFLEIVERRASQMAGLVDNFFDLARLHAGITVLDARPVDLARLAREAADAHRLAAREAGLDLRTDLEPVTVPGDPGRLRQVLDNLLSNATKYTPSGGSVRVAVRDGAAGAVIEVSDTGIGIPEDQLPHVFDHLFRASTAQDLGIAGTGLGLSITQALVTAHGGRIEVAPEPGGGTRFTVHLPGCRTEESMGEGAGEGAGDAAAEAAAEDTDEGEQAAAP